MATTKRLDLSEGADDDGSPSSRKRKPDSMHAEVEKTKKSKKKKKSVSGVNRLIWSEDDELAILKGLADRVKTISQSKIDWDDFYNSVQGSLYANVSKEQLVSKMKKLKRKFIVHMERIDQGKDPLFTRFTDSQAFGYAHMIWGQNEANGGMEKAKRTESCEDEPLDNDEPVSENEAGKMKNTAGNEDECSNKAQQTMNGEDEPVDDYEPVKEDVTEKKKVTPGNEFANKSVEKAQKTMNGEDEPVDKDELVNGNGAGTSKSDGVLDKTTEYKTAGKGSQSHEGDGDDADAEEFGVVRDAFETMLSQGLSGYRKEVQVEKLMNVETAKMKELSNEWKAICGEEERLKIRKFRLSAKLVEAANDGMK